MPTVHTKVERRRSYCPQCEMNRGVPFRVNGGRHLLVIAYHCEACGDEWTVSSAPRTVLLQSTRFEAMVPNITKMVANPMTLVTLVTLNG